MRPETLLVAFALLSVPCSGCAYELVRSGAGTASVSLTTLANDTLEPGIELVVSEALRRELVGRGDWRLVADPEAADVTIRGRVSALETSGRSFSADVRSIEYGVRMVLDLEVRLHDQAPLPLDPAALSETELYLTSADLEVGRKNREEALRRLASLLASRVYDELLFATSASSPAADDRSPR